MGNKSFKFMGRIWKAGNSYVVTIPTEVMEGKDLYTGELLLVEIKEKLKDKKEEKSLVLGKKEEIKEELPEL